VAAVSPDLKWLAVSERTRGAVWDLTKGERLFHVRGFRGAFFGDDGAVYADFPKFEQTERSIAKLDLKTREASTSAPLEEGRLSQHGAFVVHTKPVKKDGNLMQNVTMEVREARSNALLWSKNFPKEAPSFRVNPLEATIALYWSVSSEAAKAELKNNPTLAQKLSTMKEKEGDLLLQALDARTGKPLGALLIETGKGSFRISDIEVAGDWVVISDTQNRVLVYSLSTGEPRGKTFGNHPTVAKASGLLGVENERGQLAVYDLSTMQRRDQFTFSSPISLAQFSPDGKRLFVLTANQTTYLLDLSKLQ
jgi:WD40 repeat protein